MNILSLENVRKTYDKHVAVDGVSFNMPKGCVFGMLGPNGAGKTSLIRIITTITQADSGVVLYNVEKLNQNHPSKWLIFGFVDPTNQRMERIDSNFPARLHQLHPVAMQEGRCPEIPDRG
mgnify:CR=1 FL=1